VATTPSGTSTRPSASYSNGPRAAGATGMVAGPVPTGRDAGGPDSREPGACATSRSAGAVGNPGTTAWPGRSVNLTSSRPSSVAGSGSVAGARSSRTANSSSTATVSSADTAWARNCLSRGWRKPAGGKRGTPADRVRGPAVPGHGRPDRRRSGGRRRDHRAHTGCASIAASPPPAPRMTPSQNLVPGTEFLRDGGYSARRVAEHDWSTHPLGPPAGWPTELKTSLSMMFGSRFAMCLGWGPDLLLFYNDAYLPVLG